MSKRPTTNLTKNCTTSCPADSEYAIIGDTAAATLFVKRLLGNKVPSPIHLIGEGTDRTNYEGITNLDFIVDNLKSILRFLRPERITMFSGCHDKFEENGCNKGQVLQYYVPTGHLGDFISAYHFPSLGPWFSQSQCERMEKFFRDHSMEVSLNSQEIKIMKRLAANLGLDVTNKIISKQGSILSTHFLFLENECGRLSREVFLSQYRSLERANNVFIGGDVSGIKISPGSSNGLYNISACSGLPEILSNVRLVWKTNPYTFLRITSNQEFNFRKCLMIPTAYRAVISIPLVNGDSGINLSGITPREDLVTTDLTFSSPDLSSRSAQLAWLCECYTSNEDLSVLDPAGRYADSGRTLLIIEALNTKNRREASYNADNKEIMVNLNSQNTEKEWLVQFATIVSKVHNAYTGCTIPIDVLLGDASVCVNGLCSDDIKLTDRPLRESPLVSILGLASNLYGSDFYPKLE